MGGPSGHPVHPLVLTTHRLHLINRGCACRQASTALGQRPLAWPRPRQHAGVPSNPQTHGDPFVVTSAGAGSLTRAACRTQRFRQPSRALRIPVVCPDTLLTRCRAIELVSRADAVLWGPTAAELLGLPIPYRLEAAPVHVLVPEGLPRPRRSGVVARQADIVPDEVITLVGLHVTSPARTFTDLAQYLSLPDLVALGDAAMRQHAVGASELLGVLNRRLRYPGKVRARQAIPLLDPRSESPQESRLRVHIVQDGLPVPEPNLVITDSLGQFLARGDLGYRRWRIVIEYDGACHDLPERRRADATRRTLLREHGWYVVEVIAEDLRHPQRAIGKVRRALQVRGAI